MAASGSEPSILDDAQMTDSRDGMARTWTITRDGATASVTMSYDSDCPCPIDDLCGVSLAMIGTAWRRPDYVGTAADLERDPDDDTYETTCPRCNGSCADPERWSVVDYRPYGGHVTAAGTEGAMNALPRSEHHYLDRADCGACDGSGVIRADLATHLRRERGAVASLEISYGSHGEQMAVLYVEDDDWSDPAAALQSWAGELQAWQDGECYVLESSAGDVVGGFIGTEYAESEAAAMLAGALDAAIRERRERDYWRSRDVVTVAA